MRIIQISFVAIIFLFLTPYFLLIGPDKLRDYLYRELVYKVVIENIILESDTDRILEKNILNNSTWTPSRLFFKHKFLYFRQVHLANDVKCVW